VGFPFTRTIPTDTTFPGRDSSGRLLRGPLIIDVSINSWAIAYGWASAVADLQNACVTMIHVFGR
jgi:hypothetical protein